MNDIGIPEAQHRDATLLKPTRSRAIVSDGCTLRVLTAIQFNNKADGRRVEIQNETASRMLPAKINAKWSIAQTLPEAHFDIG